MRNKQKIKTLQSVFVCLRKKKNFGDIEAKGKEK